MYRYQEKKALKKMGAEQLILFVFVIVEFGDSRFFSKMIFCY